MQSSFHDGCKPETSVNVYDYLIYNAIKRNGVYLVDAW